MSFEETLTHQAARAPVLSLKIEVLEGPDTGATAQATAETLTIGSGQGNDLVLGDATVSRYHAELTRTSGGVRVVDCGSRNGTSIGAVRLERALVPAGTVLQLGRTRIRIADGEPIDVELHRDRSLGGLYGQSMAMRRLMAQIDRAAQSEASVLVVGESGTGKELIARALHDLGPRARDPFVTVDCGTLSPTLIASELFGHERGAFTGADRQHIGACERANKGTLFLDEIGELPTALQSALLGVLERRRFRRVGGTQELPIDVRVVSATNRDLRAEVNTGTFRLDLYYRIAVVTLKVAPLRERADDIPILVEHFLRESGHDEQIDDLLSPKAIKSLAEHHWPGNVRELRNFLEATITLGETPDLDASMKPLSGSAPQTDAIEELLGLPYKDARNKLLNDFEGRYLRKLLQANEQNVAKAARAARIDRTYLLTLIKKHDLR